jgi:hypothetical protein
MGRGHLPGKPGHREIKTAPEEMNGARLAQEAGAEKLEDTIRLEQRAPEAMGRVVLEWIEHDEIGRIVVPTTPLRIHGADPVDIVPTPKLGQHNRKIYGDWLGLSATEIAALKQDSVIGAGRQMLRRQTRVGRRPPSLWPASSLPASENLHNSCRSSAVATTVAQGRTWAPWSP